MTPEALAAALRLRLPNTEIVLGDKPGRVVVKMAPKPHALTVFIALSKSGDVATIEPTEIVQRPRDGAWGYKPTAEAAHECISRIASQRCTHDYRRIYSDPAIEPRIRAWAHLPDVLPMIRPKVDALLDADRKAAAKVREDLRIHEEDIAALERALGVAPTSTDPIRAAAERALSILEGACWDDGQDAYGLGEAREILRGALGVAP